MQDNRQQTVGRGNEKLWLPEEFLVLLHQLIWQVAEIFSFDATKEESALNDIPAEDSIPLRV